MTIKLKQLEIIREIKNIFPIVLFYKIFLVILRASFCT